MEQCCFKTKQPRRKFLSGLVAACTGLAALLMTPRRAKAIAVRPSGPEVDTGPILYRRTEEAERYYRTLYR